MSNAYNKNTAVLQRPKVCACPKPPLLIPQANCQTRLPRQAVTVAGGNDAWVDVANAKAKNGEWATVELGSDDLSQHLVLYDYNFGIPAGSSIVSIEVETLIGGDILNESFWDSLFLTVVAPGVTRIGGQGRAFDKMPALEQQVKDGAPDLWEAAWTPEALNLEAFGTINRIESSKNGNVGRIGWVEVTVCWS